MVGIVLVTHGKLAEELISVVNFVLSSKLGSFYGIATIQI